MRQLWQQRRQPRLVCYSRAPWTKFPPGRPPRRRVRSQWSQPLNSLIWKVAAGAVHGCRSPQRAEHGCLGRSSGRIRSRHGNRSKNVQTLHHPSSLPACSFGRRGRGTRGETGGLPRVLRLGVGSQPNTPNRVLKNRRALPVSVSQMPCLRLGTYFEIPKLFDNSWLR